VLTLHYTVNANGKLFNDCFNDIRPSQEFYHPGAEAQIIYKSMNMGIGKIIAVRTFPFSKISDLLSYLNIGHHAAYQAEMLKRYNHGSVTPDFKLDQLVIAYTQRNYEVQSELLTEWWKSKTPADHENA
jgi:hypothetical protein